MKRLLAALISASLLSACGTCDRGSSSSDGGYALLALAVILGSSRHLTVSPEQQAALDDGSSRVDEAAAAECVRALGDASALAPEVCQRMVVAAR